MALFLFFSYDQVPVVVQGQVTIVITIEIDLSGAVRIGMRDVFEPEPQLHQLFFICFSRITLGLHQAFQDPAVLSKRMIDIPDKIIGNAL